jgi:hypothetical protein
MLQKRPNCFLFQISLPKYLKSQKERFRAIFDQINSIPGLNDPLKVVHFSPHHRPSTPRPPTPLSSPGVDAPNEHVAPEVSGLDQPVNSPQINRLATPSPLRPSFEEYEDLDAGFYNSPDRTNDAPTTTDIPAGGAEGPVTLTSICTLLNRYVKKVDDLEKELKDTKANLGGQIDVLTAKVQDLETQLGQKRKRQVVIESEDE